MREAHFDFSLSVIPNSRERRAYQTCPFFLYNVTSNINMIGDEAHQSHVDFFFFFSSFTLGYNVLSRVYRLILPRLTSAIFDSIFYFIFFSSVFTYNTEFSVVFFLVINFV